MNNTLQERLDTIKDLNRGRFDYVLERSKTPQPSIDQACRNIGKTKSWFYQQLSENEREDLEKLAEDLHKSKAIHALVILENATEQAAQVKVNGLSARDPRIQQAASTEILDRVIGKPTQYQETKSTVELKAEIISNAELLTGIDKLLAAARTRATSETAE
jgi:hypothetical protein